MQGTPIDSNWATDSGQFGGSPKVCGSRYSVAAFFNRPYLYYGKFFQRLAAHPAIDLTVHFYSNVGVGSTLDPGFKCHFEWDTDLLSGYRPCFLRNYSPWPALHRFTGLFHPALLREINRGYDAVVVDGWWGLSTWLAFAAALSHRIPVLFHTDTSILKAHGVSRGNARRSK